MYFWDLGCDVMELGFSKFASRVHALFSEVVCLWQYGALELFQIFLMGFNL